MYEDIPTYANASVAAVVGAATVVIVAAPAAGRRIRVVGYYLGMSRSATGISDLSLTDGVNILRDVSDPGARSNGWVNLPEPGWRLPDATALTASVNSSAATGTFLPVVAFFYDDVT